MLQRIYIHNFRGLDNFELKLAEPSTLLVGHSGTGKSTIAKVLRLFQKIGRGINRASQLVDASDCTLRRTEIPLSFEIQVKIAGSSYRYALTFELPERFREFRVAKERLDVDGKEIFRRESATVHMSRGPSERLVLQTSVQFNIDWHLVALPVIQSNASNDPIAEFRRWLARIVVLAPVPAHMKGESHEESLEPLEDGSNFADWLTGVLAQYPSSYNSIDQFLKMRMTDLQEFRNVPAGKNAKSLVVRFFSGQAFEVAFDDLSDGEKCTFLSAVVLAANAAYGPLFVFWDEPDNFLPISEVGHFVLALRQAFKDNGQLLATSHNAETMERFSVENILHLSRASHLEPTVIRPLSDLSTAKGRDLIRDIVSGEIGHGSQSL